MVLDREGPKVGLTAESALAQRLAVAVQSDTGQDFDPTTGMVIVLSMCSPGVIIKNDFNSMLNIHRSRDFLKSLVIIFIFLLENSNRHIKLYETDIFDHSSMDWKNGILSAVASYHC